VVAGGLACFVAGFLVAPCLHNYAHQPDHTHDGSPVHGEAARAWLYHHAHPHPHGPEAADRGPGTGAPVGHGHHSSEHFGLAVPAAPLFVLAPPFRPGAFLAPPARPATIAAEAARGLPDARGPPGA
jgi:hypothetical protein